MCSEQNNWNRELSVECWFWFHSREMTIVARVLLCRTFAMSGIHRVYLLNCIEISDKLHFTCFCVYGLSCETQRRTVKLWKRSEERSRKHAVVCWQKDNARLHTAAGTQDLVGWDVIDHLPYNLDLALSDYQLFLQALR